MSFELDSMYYSLQQAINDEGYGRIDEDGIPGNDTLSHCPTLRYGSCNEVVRAMQTILSSFGYNIGADGDFGGATDNAVRSFQSNNGLGSDGIVGQNTWRALLRL